jgi:hypothetical protein
VVKYNEPKWTSTLHGHNHIGLFQLFGLLVAFGLHESSIWAPNLESGLLAFYTSLDQMAGLLWMQNQLTDSTIRLGPRKLVEHVRVETSRVGNYLRLHKGASNNLYRMFNSYSHFHLKSIQNSNSGPCCARFFLCWCRRHLRTMRLIWVMPRQVPQLKHGLSAVMFTERRSWRLRQQDNRQRSPSFSSRVASSTQRVPVLMALRLHAGGGIHTWIDIILLYINSHIVERLAVFEGKPCPPNKPICPRQNSHQSQIQTPI